MRKSRHYDLVAGSPVKKVYNYCDEHRPISGTGVRYRGNYENPDSRISRRCFKDSRNEYSNDEILVRSAGSSDSRETILKSSAIVRKYKQRGIISPTSCLKNVGSKEKGKAKKRVNFHEKNVDAYENTKDGHEDDYNDSSPSDNSRKHKNERCSSVSLSSSGDRTSSTNYTAALEANMRKLRMWRDYDRRNTRESTWISDEPFRRTITERPLRNADCPDEPERHLRPSPSSSYSRTSDSVTSEDQRILENLGRLSLTSAASSLNEPRFVKPKGNQARATIKRMFVYPPKGQKGEPLTLTKKWSNINSHVRGDPHSGYRYKVYYLQKFESEKWFPVGKSKSPFHEIEDTDCTTEYG